MLWGTVHILLTRFSSWIYLMSRVNCRWKSASQALVIPQSIFSWFRITKDRKMNSKNGWEKSRSQQDSYCPIFEWMRNVLLPSVWKQHILGEVLGLQNFVLTQVKRSGACISMGNHMHYLNSLHKQNYSYLYDERYKCDRLPNCTLFLSYKGLNYQVDLSSLEHSRGSPSLSALESMISVESTFCP